MIYEEFKKEYYNKWFQYVLHTEILDYIPLRNSNITWEIVQTNPKPNGKEWNYHYLSLNPNITWEIVQNNPDKPWDYFWLSTNPNITGI